MSDEPLPPSDQPEAPERSAARTDWLGAATKVASWGVSLLNGVLGDYLERKALPLSTPMSLYDRQGALDLTRELADQLPGAGDSLCILVHGLACNEHAWRLFSREDDDYGSLLQRDLGYTPLYLRYNSGRHVSENGRGLAQLIATLSGAWPVPVRQIVLIGHSLGGLVVRSACHYGMVESAGWCDTVSRVFLLGTPNLGAPLEKFAELASQVLKQVQNPYTYLAGGILALRSNGIKDLRYGYLLDEEWQQSPSEGLVNHRRPIPLLPDASHYVLAGALTSDLTHPVTRWFGDSLVRLPSATGQAGRPERAIPFPLENCRIFPALSHIDLIWHADVYEQIRCWCAGQPELEEN